MATRRRATVAVVALALLATGLVVVLTGYVAARAGAQGDRCARFAADSTARAAAVSGSGRDVVVIGDSWSAGLGLDDPASSWPSRLPGRVHVAGFSGSGFSARASDCGAVSFADRAQPALRSGPDLVVVEGGLNDVDQPSAAIVAGFSRLLHSLSGARAGSIVVVGPASAPARAPGVARVDLLLGALAERAGVAYVRTSDLDLDYLADGLHLTPAGHRAFGDAVAARITALHVTPV